MKTEFTVPVGNLRFIQCLSGMQCDCCTAQASMLFADDEHTGFALSFPCALKLRPMDDFEILARKINIAREGEVIKFPLPKWMAGSGDAYSKDMHTILRDRFGVTRNFYTSRHTDTECSATIPGVNTAKTGTA